MSFADFIKQGKIKVLVKPGKKATSIIGFSEDKSALIIEIGARPQDNKANIELIKFLTKKIGKKCTIKSGHTSKIKTIQLS